MKAVVAAFNQEKALVGAFSVIMNLRMQFVCNFLKHSPQSNKVYNFTFRWGTTTPTRSFTRLSCRKVTEMWFDVMMSYRDIGR